MAFFVCSCLRQLSSFQATGRENVITTMFSEDGDFITFFIVNEEGIIEEHMRAVFKLNLHGIIELAQLKPVLFLDVIPASVSAGHRKTYGLRSCFLPVAGIQFIFLELVHNVNFNVVEFVPVFLVQPRRVSANNHSQCPIPIARRLAVVGTTIQYPRTAGLAHTDTASGRAERMPSPSCLP